MQFAVRELTEDMKEPTDGSLHKLHRLARYLQGTKDYGVWLPKNGEIEILKVHSDTDWANCKKTRKSCACAMFEIGGCLLFSYARSNGFQAYHYITISLISLCKLYMKTIHVYIYI